MTSLWHDDDDAAGWEEALLPPPWTRISSLSFRILLTKLDGAEC